MHKRAILPVFLGVFWASITILPAQLDPALMIKGALEAVNSKQGRVDADGFLLIEYSAKVDIENGTDQGPLKYIYSGMTAVPLSGEARPIAIKYSTQLPVADQSGKIVDTIINKGVSKFEAGSWKNYMVEYENKGRRVPVKKLTISRPGYGNVESDPDKLIKFSPLDFILSNEESRLRIRPTQGGMIGMLKSFAEKKEDNKLHAYFEPSGQSRFVVINESSDELRVKQSITFDCEKGLAPLSYSYISDGSGSKPNFEKWNTTDHVYQKGVGWLPRAVNGEMVENNYQRKLEILVSSVKVVDKAEVEKIFQQETGPDWTVEDKVTSQTFKLGHSPGDILEKTNKIK